MFNKDDENESYFKIYTKAVLRGIIISIVLLFIFTLIFYFTKMNENYMQTVAWVITIISICYSSIYGVCKIGKRGYLHGVLIGLIYMVIVSFIGMLLEKGKINTSSMFIMYIMSAVVGMLSGMIGMVLCSKN